MISSIDAEKIRAMQAGGAKLGKIREILADMIKPGTNLLAIEEKAQALILEEGGVPSFTTVEDYQWATCLCINDEVVHGIPSDRVIDEGDVVTVDVGMIYDGYHTDTATTRIAGDEEKYPEEKKLLQVGKDTLTKAIGMAKAGNHIYDISSVIEAAITKAGYSVIKSLTGHGVGKTLHEEPMIPMYTHGKRERTPEIHPGMTLAIEIIYAEGNGSIEYTKDDGWTLGSRDRSLTVVFEHTIAVFDDRTDVLTSPSK